MGSDRQLLTERGKHAFSDPSAGKGSQRREVTLIEAGWGSSGFYPEDVLRRDGPRVFSKGTPMYLNHPTPREETERPERDVLDKVGKLVEDAYMKGDKLMSVAEVYSHWVPVIDSIADDVGLSIRAYGPTSFGEEQGKRGQIVESILERDSVDYVTEAGAGGKVGQLVESAREVALKEARNAANWLEAQIHKDFTNRADSMFADGYLSREERIALSGAIGEALTTFNTAVEADVPALLKRDPYDGPEEDESGLNESGSGRQTKEEEVADDKALSELRESVRELQTKQKDTEDQLKEAKDLAAKEKARGDRAEEGLRLREAGKIVAEEVGKIEGLPSTARQRIIESALRGGDVPTMSDGRLDGRLLEERARAAVKEEQEYLANLIGGDGSTFEFPTGGGSGTVRGLNESGADRGGGGGNEGSDDLEKVFQRMGLSEAASKVAAEGR